MSERITEKLDQAERLLPAEIQQFNEAVDDLKIWTLAMAGNSEISYAQLKDLLSTELRSCMNAANRIYSKLVRESKWSDKEAGWVIQGLRNKVKEAIRPINSIQVVISETDPTKTIRFSELHLYRYFETTSIFMGKTNVVLFEKAAEKGVGIGEVSPSTDFEEADYRRLQPAFNVLRSNPAVKLIPELNAWYERVKTALPKLVEKQTVSEVIDRLGQLDEDAKRKLYTIAIVIGLSSIDELVEFIKNKVLVANEELSGLQSDDDKKKLGIISKLAANKDLPEISTIAQNALDMDSDDKLNLELLPAYLGFKNLIYDHIQLHYRGDRTLGSLLEIYFDENGQLKESSLPRNLADVQAFRTAITEVISSLTNHLRQIDATTYEEFESEPAKLSDLKNLQRDLIRDITGKIGVLDAKLGEIESELAPPPPTPPTPTPPVPPGPPSPPEGEQNYENMSSENLYKAAKKLWDDLFSLPLQPTGDQTKSDFFLKYQKICTILSSRGVENGIDWARRAQYLLDRNQLYNADAVGVGDSMTVDYDGMLNGSPEGSWRGAATASEFNQGHLLRLLYGHEVKLDMVTYATSGEIKPSLESTDPVEQERIRGIDQILQIMCDFYADYDPNRNPKKGKFHATAYFQPALKGEFQEAIKREWKNLLGIAVTQDLSVDQEETFTVAWTLASVLDIRTYYALPFYIAGWSPQDGIKKTMPIAAERFANGKGMYYICGKGQGFVTPALLQARFSDDVSEALDSTSKRNNYKFSTEYATPIWASMSAPWIDDYDDLTEDEKVVFQRSRGKDAFSPGMWVFWTPRGTGQAPRFSPEAFSRLVMSTTTDNIDKFNKIDLNGLLFAGGAAFEYVKECEAGFSPSGNMKQDAEAITPRVTEIAQKLSPMKANLTIDGRFMANTWYMFARNSILSFGEKYHNEEMYKRYLARFIANLRASMSAAPTTEIEIEPTTLPDPLRRRFGLPLLSDNKKITIKDFVLALLPDAEELRIAGEAKFFVSDNILLGGTNWTRNTLSRKEKYRILDAIFYDPRMSENNHEQIHHLRGEGDPLLVGARKLISKVIRQGNTGRIVSEAHHHHFKPEIGDKESRTQQEEFFKATVFPKLSQENKQPKE